MIDRSKYLDILIYGIVAFIVGCSGQQEQKLPIMGRKNIVEKGGQKDTLYHRVPHFQFVNQDSQIVTPQTFENRIYVADFFFTRCQTICPKLKRQMHRVYKRFQDEEKVALLSHTIDPRHDTVEVLKQYAEKLEISTDKWHFVRDKQDSIYSIAREYMVSAQEDSTAQGGYVHSGAFILVDQNRHIRGVYDGTSPKEVDQLMKDMEWLLKHDGPQS